MPDIGYVTILTATAEANTSLTATAVAIAIAIATTPSTQTSVPIVETTDQCQARERMALKADIWHPVARWMRRPI